MGQLPPPLDASRTLPMQSEKERSAVGLVCETKLLLCFTVAPFVT
jgi:hypothetical protein